jgi:nucleoside phosphorylase
MHIVCPLEFERSALRALGRRPGVALHRCGPGAAAVAAWAAREGLTAGSTVVLAGVAGGLAAEAPTGAAVEAAAVLGDGCPAGGWRPRATLTALPRVTIVSVAAPITDAAGKRAERARSGAAVVDLEAAAFAREAEARGWRWTVVRGVSDGADDALPAGVDRWTDADGRTRPARVAAAILRRPALLPGVARLGGRSRRAMAAVAEALAAAIGSNGAPHG